jgi:hypothetical protein
MFRRIEFLKELGAEEYRNLLRAASERGAAFDPAPARFWKTGIIGAYPEPVIDAWCEMNTPRRALNKNCRFYFTESGWKRFGRPTITACQQMGTRYRVIAVKEKSVDVFYRDEIQVAVRAKKRETGVR